MVVPRDSSWFSELRGGALLPLRQTPLYSEDRIGLRALDERGALELRTAPGGHLEVSLEWLRDEIVLRYFSGNASSGGAAMLGSS